MIITIFEDNDHKNLFPLNINRASCELRCGAFTNIERLQNHLNPSDKIQLLVRDELAQFLSIKYPNILINPKIIEPSTWINGRCIVSTEFLTKISKGSSYSCTGKLIAFKTNKNILYNNYQAYIDDNILVSEEIKVDCINNIWDAIFLQAKMIIKDSEYFFEMNHGKIHPTVSIENGDNIFIAKDSIVKAGAVLDASLGPIIISEKSIIDIGSLIQGPVYIGPNCVINPGSKLRKNITLGPMCKIGGELEDVIFQGYTNKQHDGYLGHSYIGEWVNLGANTNTSDLKNNYGNIRLEIDQDIIETGRQFLGSLIGDFTRTGISTMLNTGTVIGLGANVYGGDFQKKYIKSFQWGVNSKTDLEKFLFTIEIMKKRRNMRLVKEEIILLSKLYEKNIN